MHDFQFVNAKMYILPLVYKSNVQKWTLGKFFEMWIEWRTGTNQFEQAVGTRLKRFKRSMEEINRTKSFCLN